MKKQLKGSLCLLTATMIWGTAFVAQSVGMDLIGPFTFQSVRCFLAVAFLLCVTLIMDVAKGKKFLDGWKNKKLWKTGLLCGTTLFIAVSLQQVGLVYTDAGKAGFITAMYIVLVPVCGLAFKKKPPLTSLLCIAIAVVGLYLLSCVGVSEINKGDLYVMGCALAFAVQITWIDQFAGDLDGVRLNCIQTFICGLFSIPCMLLTETVDAGNIISCWLPLAFTGIMSMGMAYTLQIIGQRDMDSTPASLIMSMESVVAALAGWLILKEVMTGWELIGSALVFAAVILSQIPFKKIKKQD